MGESAIPNRPSAIEYLRSFGDYELLEEIARGGMGVVYKARQVSLNRIVALKMILGGPTASPVDVERFRREAEAAASLKHSNIVAIHQVGEHNGQAYFAMDYVEGPSLAALGHRGLGLSRAAQYVKTVAEAIHAAHEQGILHRDLKPSNVLLDTNDQARVTDFGLAKWLPVESATRNPQSAISLTLTGQVLGTPNYMPPEQARAEHETLGRESDVYSLGGILFYLLTGHAPFESDTVAETLHQVIAVEPTSPRRLKSDVPRDLETICLKCLAKEPGRRYPTALELADDLGRWLRHEPIRARPATVSERARKWVRRHPIRAALFLAIAVAVALGVVATQESHRAGQQQIQKREAQLHERLQSVELQLTDHAPIAWRNLADLVRAYPNDRVPAERLVNALRQRVFLLPCVNALPSHVASTGVPRPDDTLSPDQRRRAFFEASITITVRDTRTDAVLLTIPNAHRLVIRSVRWSDDGQRLISAGADHTAKVWNATDGTCLLTVNHDQGVYHAELSPDGMRLLTAARDGTARLWNAANGAALGQPMTHLNTVNTARFHPSGALVATASDDHTVRLWRGEDGAPFCEPLRLHTAVEDAFFALDGLHVRVMTGDGELRTFRIALIEPLPPKDSIPQPALPSSLSAKLMSRQDELSRLVPARITFIDISPDGVWLAVASSDKVARIANARGPGWILATLTHDAVVNCARFSPDGLRVATSTATPDRRARVWDVRTGLPLTDWLEASEPIASVRFSADGRWLYPSVGPPWELHLARESAPSWLPDLAEAIAAVYLNLNPKDEAAVIATLRRVQREVALSADRDPLTLWAKEFLADEIPNPTSPR